MFKKYHPQIINILTQETLIPLSGLSPLCFQKGEGVGLSFSHTALSASEA